MIDQFFPCLKNLQDLDFSKLNKFKADIIQKLLAKKIESTPYSLLLLILNKKITEIFSTARKKVYYENEEKFITMNTLLFARSGSGKDFSLNFIDNKLFNCFHDLVRADLANE